MSTNFDSNRIRNELFRDLAYDQVPLLQNSQLKFLNEFSSGIDSAIRQRPSAPRLQIVPREAEEFLAEIQVIEENLRTIIHRLRSGRFAREKFLRNYPRWKKLRSDGIERLKEIAASINKDRFNCNVSKLTGYCVAAVGGGLTVGSAVLTFLTLGAATPLLIAGASVTASGVATAVGTSVTEFALLKNKVGEAQELRKKDSECFQEMSDWLKHSRELQDAIDAIMKIDVLGGVAQAVKKFVDDAMNITDEYRRYDYIRERAGQLLDHIPGNILDAVPMAPIATFLILLLAMYLLLQNSQNRLIFDAASATVRGIFGIVALVDDGMDILRLSALFRGSTLAARAAARGAFAVFGIALDIAGIALTSIDIHNGSLSPEAQKITEASEEMEREARLLKNVFDNLVQAN